MKITKKELTIISITIILIISAITSLTFNKKILFAPSECSDGIDNDGDSFIDLTDPDCDDENDSSESSEPTSRATYDLLNNGFPIDTGDELQFNEMKSAFGAVATTISPQGHLIYSIPTKKRGALLGRFSGQNWEILTENGWDNTAGPVPLAINYGLMEFVSLKFFYSNNELNFISWQFPKIATMIPDSHGASVHGKLNANNKWEMWSLLNYFNDTYFQHVFYSWGGGYMDAAFNDDKSRALLVEGYQPIVPPYAYNNRPTAALYEQSGNYIWHRWNVNQWVPFDGSSTRDECVNAVICSFTAAFNEPPDQNKKIYPTSKSVVHIKNSPYFLIIYEFIQFGGDIPKYTAALYNENTETWSWWTGTEWSAEPAGFNYVQFINGIPLGLHSSENNISEIFYAQGSGLYVNTFNLTSNMGSITSLGSIGDYSSRGFASGVDSSGNLWTAKISGTNSFIVSKRSNRIWSDVKTYNGISPTIRGIELIGATPIIFFSDIYQDKERLFALSDVTDPYWQNQQSVNRDINRNNYLADQNQIMFEERHGSETSSILLGNMETDKDNYTYIPSPFVFDIKIYNPSGNNYVSWGSVETSSTTFVHPNGIAIHQNKNKTYVADYLAVSGGGRYNIESGQIEVWNTTLRETETTASLADFIYNENLRTPSDVAVDEQNNILYIVESRGDTILKYDILANGAIANKRIFAGGRGNQAGKLYWPTSIDVDDLGNVYVAEYKNHRIQKFNSAGSVLWVSGSLGQNPGQFEYPFSITTNNDYVVVSDAFTNFVTVLNKTNGEFIYRWNSYLDSVVYNFTMLGGVHARANKLIIGDKNGFSKFSILGFTGCSAEICDGLDNDCDGQTDEEDQPLCTDGVECAVGSCTAGQCVYNPSDALCPQGMLCDINQGCYYPDGFCGDDEINLDEECDNNNLNGQTCITQGYPDGGILQCTECSFNFSLCSELPTQNSFNGDTTNFSSVPDINAVQNAVIENTSFGKINFSGQSINFSRLDLDTNILFNSLTITVNTDVGSMNRLNVPSTISFYNVDLINPMIYRDGNLCSACTKISYANNIYVSTAPGFSTYTLEEEQTGGTQGGNNGGGGGGGGGGSGGGSTPPPTNNNNEDNCIVSWQCSDWSDCISGEQTRTCYDSNNCNINTNKPSETRTCTSISQEETKNEDIVATREFGSAALKALGITFALIIVLITGIIIFLKHRKKETIIQPTENKQQF